MNDGLTLPPGYELLEILQPHPEMPVVRAEDQRTHRAVVMRLCINDIHGLCIRLQRAWNICSALDSPRLEQHLALLEYSQGLALITEDFDAIPLDDWMALEQVDLSAKIKASVDLAEAVADIHREGILHLNIKPSNVVINVASRQLKVIDFGMATREPDSIGGTILGSLAYMSPEHTGRTGQSLDHRSDLYSLGITLYELFTRQLPFEEEDAMAMVHSHIAKQPLSPHQVNPDTPFGLSDLIMKLLAKAPEERYQSAQGLLQDLRTAWGTFRRTGTIASFTLGREDVGNTLTFPDHQYGREGEVVCLFEHFQQARNGKKRWVLVEGDPGTGKTALLRHLQRPILETTGLYCYGKFDALEQQMPYQGIVAAIRDLIAHLLTLDEQQLLPIISRVKGALGQSTDILQNLIPELGLLLRESSSEAPLQAIDSTRQVLQLLRRLIAIMAHEQHPLILCLDNLQWADEASLQLIQALFLQPGAENLLLISACRPKAVQPEHPLHQVLTNLEGAKAQLHHIDLRGLDTEAMSQLLADVLQRPTQEVVPLATVLNVKTAGNPYFTRELLFSLTKQQLMRWKHGHWQWNLVELQHLEVTDNVAELVTERIRLLPTDTLCLLETAACLGSSFQLSTLVATCGLGNALTLSALDNAKENDILQPDLHNQKRQFRDRGTASQRGYKRYKFTHERIQQTTYRHLSNQVRRARHKSIGTYLKGILKDTSNKQALSEVLKHLNLARNGRMNQSQRLELAALNLRGAQEYYSAGAYEAALELALIGIELLPSEPWSTAYQQTLGLHTQAARCQLMMGDMDGTLRHVNTVRNHANKELDRTEVDLALLQAQIAQGQYAAVIKSAQQTLEKLGHGLPQNSRWPSAFLQKTNLRWRLKAISERELEALPPMTNPVALAAMEILKSVLPAVALIAPKDAPNWIYKMVQITLEAGNGPWSPLAWASYASLLANSGENPELGQFFSKLATLLLNTTDNPVAQGPVFSVQATSTDLWSHGSDSNIQKLQEGWQLCLKAGDLEYATFSLTSSIPLSVLAGTSLSLLTQRYDRHLEEVSDLYTSQGKGAINCWLQAIKNLCNPDVVQPVLIGECYDISAIQNYEDGAETTKHLAQVFLAIIFREVELAAKHLDILTQFITPHISPYYQSFFHFASALTYLSQCNRETNSNNSKFMANALVHQEALGRWARHLPNLNAHRYELIRAERLKVLGKWDSALRHYQKASEGAREQSILHEEALICEYQSLACKEAGLTDMAGYTLNRSRAIYRQWGAQAKVQSLGKNEKSRSSRGSNTRQKSDRNTITNDSLKATRKADTAALDLHSVIQAAQALSKEIELSRLLKQVMRIVIENAGAERGVLLLNTDGQLHIEAEGNAASQDLKVELNGMGRISERVPLSIITYAQHTLQNVVLTDALADDRFARDQYLQKQQPRSVLSIPFLNQGALTGILYLEHRSASGIFTPNRLEVLEVLISQLAVSIENARMFEVQRKMAQSFSRFVPVQFLQALGKNRIEDVQLGDCVERKITVLFTDLRGFTSLSEDLNTRENFELLNAYFRRMEPSIQRHGGFVDKYIGDAIMALFPGNADDGLLAGLSMFGALNLFNQELAKQGMPSIRMGIGLHSGPLMLGTVGSPRRMETTVIGDTVNLAARLEGMTKVYQTPFVLSEATHDALNTSEGYAVRRLDRVIAKGKTHPVTIFEVLSADISDKCLHKLKTLEAFNMAVDLYLSRDFEPAALLFESCLDEVPDDEVAKRYLERCRYFVRRPPPEDWDGSCSPQQGQSRVAS